MVLRPYQSVRIYSQKYNDFSFVYCFRIAFAETMLMAFWVFTVASSVIILGTDANKRKQNRSYLFLLRPDYPFIFSTWSIECNSVRSTTYRSHAILMYGKAADQLFFCRFLLYTIFIPVLNPIFVSDMMTFNSYTKNKKALW